MGKVFQGICSWLPTLHSLHKEVIEGPLPKAAHESRARKASVTARDQVLDCSAPEAAVHQVPRVWGGEGGVPQSGEALVIANRQASKITHRCVLTKS